MMKMPEPVNNDLPPQTVSDCSQGAALTGSLVRPGVSSSSKDGNPMLPSSFGRNNTIDEDECGACGNQLPRKKLLPKCAKCGYKFHLQIGCSGYTTEKSWKGKGVPAQLTWECYKCRLPRKRATSAPGRKNSLEYQAAEDERKMLQEENEEQRRRIQELEVKVAKLEEMVKKLQKPQSSAEVTATQAPVATKPPASGEPLPVRKKGVRSQLREHAQVMRAQQKEQTGRQVQEQLEPREQPLLETP